MDIVLDKAHELQLESIFNKALTHAEHCVENESPHTAYEWMDIAKDADHILRKHYMLKQGILAHKHNLHLDKPYCITRVVGLIIL